MAANLIQIRNFTVNFHKEFKLFSKKKIDANNGDHFKIVSIIKKHSISICPHKTLKVWCHARQALL